MMVIRFVATSMLLLWNAAYCCLTIRRDLAGPTPARGVWGLFALAGTLSVIAMAVLAVGVGMSGI